MKGKRRQERGRGGEKEKKRGDEAEEREGRGCNKQREGWAEGCGAEAR